MSDSVVIKKSLADQICQLEDVREGYPEIAQALRAAPEPVSLDGVRQWTPYEISIAKGDQILRDRHRFYLDDDLRRLVAPVQPSAVVSREFTDDEIARMLHVGMAFQSGRFSKDKAISESIAYLNTLQLPQPVAPVQSGGVVESLTDLLKDVTMTEYGFEIKTEWMVQKIIEIVTHLATTQSAPSVPLGDS